MPFIAAESIETSSGRMGWECFMSDIVHGGIREPCSSLWRRGNGHLVSLRTYSSCVLVRSGI